MKTLKKILIPIFLVTTLLLTLALASCKKDCEHEFNWLTTPPTCTEEGVALGTCTKCGETDRVTSQALGHTADGLICEVCGDPTISLTSLFPEISEETSSLGVVVKDVHIAGPESTETIDLAELVVYSTEDGIGGYVDATATATYTDGYTEVVNVYGFIEGENLYLHIYNSAYERTDKYSVYPISTILAKNPQISEALAMAEMLLPSIEAWFNESFLPCFGEITPPEGSEAPELTEESAIKALTAILDLFFKVESTEAGYTVILDLSIIKDTHNAFNEKTVAEIIDIVGGEGRFENLEKLIPTMLDYTVADLVEFVSVNLGVDVTKLLASLDDLAAIISGNPAVTFEMLLGIEGLDDIQALLNNEEFLATNVRDFLMTALEIEDAATLDAQITEIVNALKTATPYQLMQVDAETVAETGEAIDTLLGMISYEITVGKDGKFVSSDLDVAIEEEMLYINANLTPEKLAVTLTNGVEDGNRIAFEIIPGYEPKPNTEKEAEIKAAVSDVPEITEESVEIMATYYYDFIPVYEGDKLVGATLLSDYWYTENEEGYPVFYIYTVEVDFGLLSVDVIPGCSGKITISYTAPSALYVDKAYIMDEYVEIEDELAYASLLFHGSYDFVIENEYNTSTTFEICYDPATDEYIEYADHNHEYDVENSIVGEGCGSHAKDVYVCTECGDVSVYEYTVEHDEESFTKTHTYNEETRTFTCTFTCGCGEVVKVFTVHITGDIALTYRETENTSADAMELAFTLPAPGNYIVAITSVTDDGYAHIYSGTSYVTTNSFDVDVTETVEGTFNSENCYLSLRFFDTYVENEVTISVYPAE